MFLIDLLYVMSVWMCIPQALDFVSRLPQLIHAKTSAGNPENHSRFAKPLSDVGTASTFSRMHIWTIHTSLYRCAERAWLCTTHTLLWIHLGCLPICTMCAHTHTHPNKLRIGGRITEKGALQFIHMTLEHTGQDVASCMRVCEGQDLEHRYELAVGAGEVASALILYGVLLGQAQ